MHGHGVREDELPPERVEVVHREAVPPREHRHEVGRRAGFVLQREHEALIAIEEVALVVVLLDEHRFAGHEIGLGPQLGAVSAQAAQGLGVEPRVHGAGAGGVRLGAREAQDALLFEVREEPPHVLHAVADGSLSVEAVHPRHERVEAVERADALVPPAAVKRLGRRGALRQLQELDALVAQLVGSGAHERSVVAAAPERRDVGAVDRLRDAEDPPAGGIRPIHAEVRRQAHRRAGAQVRSGSGSGSGRLAFATHEGVPRLRRRRTLGHEIAEDGAGLHGRELLRVAEQHEPRVVRRRAHQPVHQKQVHH